MNADNWKKVKIDFVNFTPISALIGGIVIGLAVVLFFYSTGRLAGVSGIANNALTKNTNRATNLLFLMGIITGFFIFYITKIINALSLAGKMPLLFGSMLPIILPLFLAVALIIHADEK